MSVTEDIIDRSARRAARGEKIGGGFIVLRRGVDGRLGSGRRGRGDGVFRPFEHASDESAIAEANRIAESHPGATVCVFQQIFMVKSDAVV